VAQWLNDYRTWNSSSGTRIRFPGRDTIPLGSNLGQVPPPSQFLNSEKLGYKKKF